MGTTQNAGNGQNQSGQVLVQILDGLNSFKSWPANLNRSKPAITGINLLSYFQEFLSPTTHGGFGANGRLHFYSEWQQTLAYLQEKQVFLQESEEFQDSGLTERKSFQLSQHQEEEQMDIIRLPLGNSTQSKSQS